jgi:hypothetical protein
MRKGLIGLVSLAVGIAFLSCEKDKVDISNVKPECEEDTVSYMNVIEPMILQNCSTSGCHDASQAGGYTFDDHSNISANADIILNVIDHNSGFTPMPLGQPKLPHNLIEDFDCWIYQGKLEN